MCKFQVSVQRMVHFLLDGERVDEPGAPWECADYTHVPGSGATPQHLQNDTPGLEKGLVLAPRPTLSLHSEQTG